MNKEIKIEIIITGIICLTILELFAISQGINGTLLTIVVAIIASAIGVFIPMPKGLS